jgi:hypothetical protein
VRGKRRRRDYTREEGKRGKTRGDETGIIGKKRGEERLMINKLN